MTELELQQLIKESPELLSPIGTELEFVPVGWEVPLGAGRLDALFLDSNGLLTLVETKLRANDESRREVIGQVLEYAVFASEWGPEDLRRHASAFLGSKQAPPDIAGRSFEEAIAIRLGWLDLTEDERTSKLDALFAQAEANLDGGRLRVVCGVDERIENLERLVRYLTVHSDLEVVLLQVNRFAVEQGLSVLIPSLHGNVEERSVRRSSSPNARMTVAEVIESFPEGDARDAVARLIGDARAAGAIFEPGPSGLSIRAKSPSWKPPVSVGWIFAPGKWGWQKTKEISFGHGLAAVTTPPLLSALLDEYFQDLESIGGADASSKDVRARWFTPLQVAQNYESLSGRMLRAIRDLAALPPITE